jgi:hypothetical protein
MHIGVYGSGYLATVISACLADFGTPVCCCHADSSHIVEVAKGNIPFYEKNLQNNPAQRPLGPSIRLTPRMPVRPGNFLAKILPRDWKNW